MKTWQDSYQQAQAIAGDTEAATLIQIKADINLGAHKFNAALNRYITRRAKTTDIVEDQQYYQTPPDCIRVIKVRVKQSTSSTNKYPVRQIRHETDWDALNTVNQRGNWATYYFARGNDEVGI